MYIGSVVVTDNIPRHSAIGETRRSTLKNGEYLNRIAGADGCVGTGGFAGAAGATGTAARRGAYGS